MSFPLHSPASALVAWIVVGRAWAGASRGATAPAGARRTFVATAALLAFGLLVLGAFELKTRAALGQAIRAERAGDCDTALRLASPVVRSTRLRDARGTSPR